MLTSLKDRRVMLLGGAGFIGHNLAMHLNELGAKVEILDGLQVNNLGSLLSTSTYNPNRMLYTTFIHERLKLLHDHDITLHVQDLRDYHSVSRAIAKFEPDTVIHLAAIAHANRANKDPFSTFDHSGRTLENALDASRSLKPHFIYFSSSMVYGNFENGVVDETTPCNPLGIYGSLKFGGEKLVIAYNQVFDLPYTIIRPSALYGERCVSRRVIQIFIERVLMGKPVTVIGDGSEKLDFTYIDDFIQGVILAASNEAAKSEIFNITYGNARSLMDIVNIIKETIPGFEVSSEDRDSLMPERGTLSIDKAKTILGYSPQFPVDKGVPKYLDWYLDFKKRYPELFTQ